MNEALDKALDERRFARMRWDSDLVVLMCGDGGPRRLDVLEGALPTPCAVVGVRLIYDSYLIGSGPLIEFDLVSPGFEPVAVGEEAPLLPPSLFVRLDQPHYGFTAEG